MARFRHERGFAVQSSTHGVCTTYTLRCGGSSDECQNLPSHSRSVPAMHMKSSQLHGQTTLIMTSGISACSRSEDSPSGSSGGGAAGRSSTGPGGAGAGASDAANASGGSGSEGTGGASSGATSDTTAGGQFLSRSTARQARTPTVQGKAGRPGQARRVVRPRAVWAAAPGASPPASPNPGS